MSLLRVGVSKLARLGTTIRQVAHPPSHAILDNSDFLLGQIDKAASLVESALDRARRLGERGDEANALRILADIVSGDDCGDAAELHYRKALALGAELEMRPLVAHCHAGLAKLYRRTGKRQEAQEHLATATTMYREMGMMYWLEKAEKERR